jgi:hypothetical protein
MTFERKHGGTLMILGMVTVMGCGMEDPNAPPAPGVQLQDDFSKTGSLIVNLDDDGQLSVSIQGRIGADNQAIGAAASLKQTLAETYLVLHPDALVVPDQVLALSEKLAKQRKLALATTIPPDASSVGPEASVPKDANAFYANACVSSPPGFAGYTADFCTYQPNFHALCTLYQMATNDRSNAWNDTPYTATHSLSGTSATVTIPTFYWNWTQWYGSYTGRRACLTINGPQSNTGAIGITHQSYFTDEAFNPVDG